MPGPDAYRPPVPIVGLLLGIGATNVMIYWGVVAVSQALTYFRRYKEREVLLAEARLQSLRTQLHPHFLFNTLNAIAELIYEDASRAERTITQLSDLLRVALRRGPEQEVTLKEELDFLRNYVEIQQTLLQERLVVRWRVADEALDALVPNMILQPLVENAIRHGIGPRREGGSIEIAASREGDGLRLRVEDDGLGADPASLVGGGGGLGLSNTRARLRHLYGDAHEFELSGRRTGGGGLVASLVIPFREGRGEGSDEDSHADR
jgi:sensor histidine kinase YesM